MMSNQISNTNNTPIFPISEPQHFSDYGFDPQIDYFQVRTRTLLPPPLLLIIINRLGVYSGVGLDYFIKKKSLLLSNKCHVAIPCHTGMQVESKSRGNI